MKSNTTINFSKFCFSTLLISLCISSSGICQDAKPLPAPVNTAKFTETSPSISADGKTLIFESDRQGDWKLFETRRNGKVWAVPVPITKINSTFYEKSAVGTPCLSYDGNTLFFSASSPKSVGKEDIFYSIREKNGWSAPMNIGYPINSEDNESFPSLSPDGKSLYFSRGKPSEGKNPMTCNRIMVARKGADGTWGNITELQQPINSICEKAPRIMPDGKTLIFSSIRKDGQGNFDFYKSELQTDGSWSEVLALDFINTPFADFGAAVSACGDVMYFVKNGDIVAAPVPFSAVPIVEGFVTDSISGKTLATKILISEFDNPTQTVAEYNSNATDGKYVAILQPHKKYIFEISESGYYRKKVIVDLTDEKTCETIGQDIKLFPMISQEQAKDAYQLSFLAVDAQTNMTIPATFEAKETKSGQTISLNTNEQTLQNQGIFKLKEDYLIEATFAGYRTQGLALRIDDRKDLLPVSIIKLEPISSNFRVKAIDGGTNELLKDAKISITDIATNQSVTVVANPETGECVTNLIKDKKYKIVISSDFFDENEQIIRKTDELASITLKLIPKKTTTITFVAIDAETNKELTSEFTIISEKTGKSYKGKSESEDKPFAMKIDQLDNLKVESSSEGYASGRNLIEITNSILTDKRPMVKIPMIIDRYPLVIRVLDAETQKPIKDAVIKIADLKTGEAKQAVRGKSNDYSSMLRRSGKYDLTLKSEDYLEIKETLEKAPEGNALIITLHKKKALPVNFVIFDAETNRPLRANMTIKLEKSNKNYTLTKESDYEIKVTEREVFTVETSATGYKPLQSTFNMADFSPEKKYSFPVKLEKAVFVLTIKTVNKVTGDPVDADGFAVADLSPKASKPDVARQANGIASVSLNPENKYLLKIEAEGYEPFSQELNKLTSNELVCTLVPKPQESAFLISAVDSVSGRVLDATFKIKPSKSVDLITGRTSEIVPNFKYRVVETDDFSLETFVRGYHLKSENITYQQLGKVKKHTVTMSRDFSVLSLKAYDSENNQPVREVFYSLVDAMNNRPVAAMITLPNGECSADLKPGKEYIIKAQLSGYEDHESRFTASVEDANKPVRLRSLRKITLFLYAIDALKKNKISATFKIHAPDGAVVATGKTDGTRQEVSAQLYSKTNYKVEVLATGYKSYEGKITPDSSMRGERSMIPIWLEKDESKFSFRVIDAQTRKIVPNCKAKMIDVKSNQELNLVKEGDEYFAELSPVASYRLDIEAEGYANYIRKIDPSVLAIKSERKLDISLLRKKENIVAKAPVLTASVTNPKEKLPESKGFDKVEKGKAIVLNNVYFEQSSFIMLKESFPELDKVVQMMKTNPSTKIEIAGHTDNVGDPRLNLALSENRAKVILNYLVGRGIDEDRLTYKGYGGTKPVASNEGEDSKKKNRRVEIVGIQ